jgi:hypothetical protein
VRYDAGAAANKEESEKEDAGSKDHFILQSGWRFDSRAGLLY